MCGATNSINPGACLPEGAHHVNSGRDGRVQQKSLVRGEAGVCDCPAQIPCMHILAQAPVILCLVYPDAPVVLVRSCTERCLVSLKVGTDARHGRRLALPSPGCMTGKPNTSW